MNVNKLPDCYKKGTSSNNYKLLNINEQAVEQLNSDIQDVYDVLDIEKATGATLDLYGEMLGQKRGSMTDAQYRLWILTRVGMNVAQGSYDTVIGVLKNVFNCTADEIILDDADKPCRVAVINFPYEMIVRAGYTGQDAIDMIESLLPIGVTVDEANFSGTFEFSDAYEYDENTGFGDIEQTIGGFLGLLV